MYDCAFCGAPRKFPALFCDGVGGDARFQSDGSDGHRVGWGGGSWEWMDESLTELAACQ